MKALYKIGFWIGYVWTKIFIAPFPKARENFLRKRGLI